MFPVRKKPGLRCVLLSLAFLLLNVSIGKAQTLIPLNSTWRYFKGTAEASSPISAWREKDFADEAWSSGPAPFYYGETFASGTLLNDMRNGYTSFFLRQSFSVADP